MKRTLYMICFFFLSFIFISTVNATNYVNNVFKVSLDGNNYINYDEEIVINVNINVFYNLSSVIGNIEYDNSKLELLKCESEFFVCTFSNDKILLDSIEGIEGNKNIAKLTFKVLNNFKPNDDTEIFLTSVNGSDNTKGNNTKIKIHRFQNDTNLTSLVIKDETLVPDFTPDNTIYNLRTKKTSIDIEATSKSKIVNTGIKELKIGNNIFEIIVKAENGEEKKYIINAFREENNKIDNETSATNKDSDNKKNDVSTDNSKDKEKNPTTDNENKTLSSNKKLKYLKIAGIDVELKEDLYEYNITIDSSFKELNIDYELDDKKSKVVISGDTKFSKEENLVVISVIAEDGSQLNYKINIIKKDNNSNNIYVEEDTNKLNNKNLNSYDETSKSNNNLINIIKMIMFIVVFIVGIIVLKKIFSKK